MQPAHNLVGVGNQRNVAIWTQATFGTCLGIVPQSVGAIGRYGFLSHDGARRGVNQGALSQNHPSLSREIRPQRPFHYVEYLKLNV